MTDKNINIENLIKPSNLAKKLGINRQYIYELYSDNKIDSIKIDGVVFIKMTDRTKNKLNLR